MPVLPERLAAPLAVGRDGLGEEFLARRDGVREEPAARYLRLPVLRDVERQPVRACLLRLLLAAIPDARIPDATARTRLKHVPVDLPAPLQPARLRAAPSRRPRFGVRAGRPTAVVASVLLHDALP